MRQQRRITAAVLAAAFATLGAGPPATRPTTGPAVDGADGRRAYDDLAAHYADPAKGPDVAGTLVALDGKDAAERQRAGRYLTALFTQSEADERNGRAEWRPSPFWGEGPASAARKFRTAAAKQLDERGRPAEALDAAAWLVEHDPVPDDQAAGIDALRQIDSPRLADVIGRLLSPPSHTRAVLVGAIRTAGDRRMTALAGVVAPLATDCRAGVRQAVREAASRLGFVPVPYAPAAGFAPWVVQDLDRVAGLPMTDVPPTATWSRFDVTVRPPANEPKRPVRHWQFSGWLLDRPAAGSLRALDLYGQEQTLAAADTVVTARTFKEDADELAESRGGKGESDANRVGALSQDGPLSGQFEPRFVSVPEALLAAWAYRHGDPATAATVLFPRYDEAPDDRWVAETVGSILGWHYFDDLLHALCDDRDYPAAVRIGRRLRRSGFERFQDRPLADELTTQLEARQGVDFVTLTLPTPADWAGIKRTLSRPAQADYLASRLRLINDYPMSMGDDTQYSQSHAARGLNARGETTTRPTTAPVEVINPHVELRDMQLTVAEAAALVPHLGDNDYLLTYTYWRDFAPGRSMIRAGYMVSWVFNTATVQPVFDRAAYDAADAAGQRRIVVDVSAWIAAHRDWPRVRLLSEVARTTTEYWHFRPAVVELAKTDPDTACRVLLDRVGQFPNDRAMSATVVYYKFPKSGLDVARSWATDKDTKVRFWAAMTLFHAGGTDRKAGLNLMRPILAGPAGGDLWPPALDELLTAPSDPDAVRLAMGVFDAFGRYPSDRVRSARTSILRRLILMGRQEALDYTVRQLADDTAGSTWFGDRKGESVSRQNTVDDAVAADAAYLQRDGGGFDALAPDDERAAFRKGLSQWLTDQFAIIRAGGRSAIKSVDGPLGGFDAYWVEH